MKHPLFGLLAVVALSAACSQNQVAAVLTDARWGLAAGCSQEWVPAADCLIVDTGLAVAIDVATKAPSSTIKADVIKVLKATDAKLPADSRAKPYFDYVLVFLSNG